MTSEGTVAKVEDKASELAHEELHDALEPAAEMLPGELHPHPSPLKYVVIAVILCVLTSLELAVSYSEGSIPDGLIVTLLLVMAFVKFVIVAGWYMHLQTDNAIFRRFFILGIVGAVIVYMVALTSLHVFS
jgi:cytochrome c oxidase subunit 4